MEIIPQQIWALQAIVTQQQVSVKRQRFAIIALAGIIVAGGFIAAATFADGNATVSWLDKDEKMRITVTTFSDGFSSLAWFDKNMKTRIDAEITADGKVLLPTKGLEPPKP